VALRFWRISGEGQQETFWRGSLGPLQAPSITTLSIDNT
jgi:hypothetical protein